MDSVLGLSDIQKAQLLLYRRNVMHYANSVLNRDISFDRAIKTLHFDTGYSIPSLEDDLCYAVNVICPLRNESERLNNEQ